jgi:hypothetical protein
MFLNFSKNSGSLVRPKVVKSVHYCPATNAFLSREYRDITSFVGLPTGSVYPTRVCAYVLHSIHFNLSKPLSWCGCNAKSGTL